MMKRIYKKFVRFFEEKYQTEVNSWFGMENSQLSRREIKEIYNTYYKPTLVEFWSNVKLISNSKTLLNSLKFQTKEAWEVKCYTEFILEEGLGKIIKEKLILLSSLSKKLLPVFEKKEVIRKIKRKFGNFDLNLPSYKLIERRLKRKISFESSYDQLPISMESVVNLINKISIYYPFFDQFMFIGDDDFLSVFFTLVEEKFDPIVIDIDKNILDTISMINRNIRTRTVDISKNKRLKFKIKGFLCNPPYTEIGIKRFVGFGVKNFGLDGGFSFVVIGDEAIGKRIVSIERFFLENGFQITEISKSAVYYPFQIMHPEDRKNYEFFKSVFGAKIQKNYMLAADLFVLSYIPWKIKKIEVKNATMYTYI